MASSFDPAWLRSEITRLEQDAQTTEDGEEATTGLTLVELNLLEQYRFELRQIENP